MATPVPNAKQPTPSTAPPVLDSRTAPLPTSAAPLHLASPLPQGACTSAASPHRRGQCVRYPTLRRAPYVASGHAPGTTRLTLRRVERNRLSPPPVGLELSSGAERRSN